MIDPVSAIGLSTRAIGFFNKIFKAIKKQSNEETSLSHRKTIIDFESKMMHTTIALIFKINLRKPKRKKMIFSLDDSWDVQIYDNISLSNLNSEYPEILKRKDSIIEINLKKLKQFGNSFELIFKNYSLPFNVNDFLHYTFSSQPQELEGGIHRYTGMITLKRSILGDILFNNLKIPFRFPITIYFKDIFQKEIENLLRFLDKIESDESHSNPKDIARRAITFYRTTGIQMKDFSDYYEKITREIFSIIEEKKNVFFTIEKRDTYPEIYCSEIGNLAKIDLFDRIKFQFKPVFMINISYFNPKKHDIIEFNMDFEHNNFTRTMKRILKRKKKKWKNLEQKEHMSNLNSQRKKNQS